MDQLPDFQSDPGLLDDVGEPEPVDPDDGAQGHGNGAQRHDDVEPEPDDPDDDGEPVGKYNII